MVRKYLFNYLKSIYKTLLFTVLSEFITFCNILLYLYLKVSKLLCTIFDKSFTPEFLYTRKRIHNVA